jgi:hypothetical protein
MYTTGRKRHGVQLASYRKAVIGSCHIWLTQPTGDEKGGKKIRKYRQRWLTFPYSNDRYSRTSISGTALSGRTPISGRFLCAFNVKRDYSVSGSMTECLFPTRLSKFDCATVLDLALSLLNMSVSKLISCARTKPSRGNYWGADTGSPTTNEAKPPT